MFVAQKLGFIRCSDRSQLETCPDDPKRGFQDLRGELFQQKRFASEDSYSQNGSISLGKLKITDTSDSEANQSRTISIPVPLRVVLQTQSDYVPQEQNLSSEIQSFPKSSLLQFSQMSMYSGFLFNPYLPFLSVPYGTPTKFIGPITQSQRKQKVDRYLEKKNTRQWKSIKYAVRKELAQGRKRVQGRFTKSSKKWRWNQIMTPTTSVIPMVGEETQQGDKKYG